MSEEKELMLLLNKLQIRNGILRALGLAWASTKGKLDQAQILLRADKS